MERFVICIKEFSYLTIGKRYMVIETNDEFYKIKRDNGIPYLVNHKFFKIEEPSPYDFINPDHYKQGEKETWEMMLEIWGKKAFITHCQMTAYKYMQRLGKKPDNSVEQDLKKAKWYLDKAQELLNS